MPAFPPKHLRPQRIPWPTLVALFALIVVIQAAMSRRTPSSGARGSVVRLTEPDRRPDVAGRPGDLVLSGLDGSSITVGAAPNIKGHRPLLGAIVDVGVPAQNRADPLIWFRTVQVDKKDELKDLPVRPPDPFKCEDGAPGIRSEGALGVGLTAHFCAESRGRFDLETTLGSLPDDAQLVDEINVGSLPVIVEHDGAVWDTDHDTSFVVFSNGGAAVLLEAPGMHVRRSFSHFGEETFPSPVVVRYGHERTIRRRFTVLDGDELTAVSRVPASNRTLEVTFGPDRGGEIVVADDAGHALARGKVSKGETRSISVPPGFGTYAILRDDRGIVTDAHVPLPEPRARANVRAMDAPSGIVSLRYRDTDGSALPVHALFKGLDGAADPLPTGASGRAYSAGRSLYLLDGQTTLNLAPGRYRVTASHGLAYSLSVEELTVEAGKTIAVDDTLHRAVDTTGWLSADFHLHAAPSPDSSVTLDERVASLVTEGVDLAVATDHNHVTDYAPNVASLGVASRIGTVAGVEITSAGQKWGHFNAYPLPLPKGAPEQGVPVYYGELPADMFRSARELGARVVQVNHARMAPQIGYFDLAHLDAKTGRADPVFAPDFDVLEAYNGMWIETLDKVREGPVDLVALARRGKRVAATGDSDSHKLLFEEAGYPRTWVHTAVEPADTRVARTISALLTADTTVSSGPFVELTVDGQPIGAVVRTSGKTTVRAHVRVSAPEWVPVDHVEIWRDDAVAQRFDVTGPKKDGVRFERDVDVEIGTSDAVVLAWADAETPLPDVVPYDRALSIGFSGLIYVDSDGDGTVKVPPATEHDASP